MPHDNCPRYPSFAECGLRYNLSDSEREGDEVLHQTERDVPPITMEEHFGLGDILVPIIEKHNRLYGFSTQGLDHYYLVADQFRGDRTTEVAALGKANYTVELVNDLQAALQRGYRLWRILLEATATDDLVLVYPNAARNNDAVPGESLTETLTRVNMHAHAWTRLCLRYAVEARPGFQPPTTPPRLVETKVLYNSAAWPSCPDLPVFNTAADLAEPSIEEFLAFEVALASAIARHGPVVTMSDLSDTSKERLNALWIVRKLSMCLDRTRVLVKYGDREFSATLIGDIQSVLQEWPLWRVALDAENEPDVRFVYPEFVH
jgi:hypothetical protein